MPRKVLPLAPARLRLRHLQPLCLALLARQPGSGYDVVTALSVLPLFATARPDAPGVYRTLQAFEKRGLLRGRRQYSNKGPARCEYTLTPAGHTCLAQWQTVLLAAREEIDVVLALVQRGKKFVSRKGAGAQKKITVLSPRLRASARKN